MRIQLLSNAELEELYSLPQFTDNEREVYFFMDEQECQRLDQYKKPLAKIYFILQLGYFRAKNLFFTLNPGLIIDDIVHIAKRYSLGDFNKKLSQVKIWKESLRQQKSDILALFHYREWSIELRSATCTHLADLVKLFPKGNDTIRELLVFFEKERITLPSYRVIQDMFTEVFSVEKDRLNAMMTQLPENIQLKLDTLIKNDNGLTQLNVMRYDQKDFKYHSIKNEVKKVRFLSELHAFGKKFTPALELSTNTIRYYATLVEQYTASRLRKLNKPQQSLYVLCFVFYRYQVFIDNLITSFMIHVKLLMSEGVDYAKEKEDEYIEAIKKELPNLAQFLTWFSSGKDEVDLSRQEFQQEGFSILERDKQIEMAKYILGKSFDTEAVKWEFYEKSSRLITLYLRPILLEVTFGFHKPNSKILQLIEFLRQYHLSNKGGKNIVLSKVSMYSI